MKLASEILSIYSEILNSLFVSSNFGPELSLPSLSNLDFGLFIDLFEILIFTHNLSHLKIIIPETEIKPIQLRDKLLNFLIRNRKFPISIPTHLINPSN